MALSKLVTLDESIFQEAESRLRTLSGGLIDIIHPTKGEVYVQFMHQTCKEWVEDLKFKHIVLEERSKLTLEKWALFSR